MYYYGKKMNIFNGNGKMKHNHTYKNGKCMYCKLKKTNGNLRKAYTYSGSLPFTRRK